MNKKPSEMWKDYLHENKSFMNAVKDSYEMYLDKYAKMTGPDQPEEKFDTKVLVPGKIYSFLYKTNEKPDPKKRPVIDRRPIFLSMGMVLQDRIVLETGIDLMMIPPKVRPIFLDRVWHFFKSTIKENEENLSDGKKGRKALKLNYAVASKIFDKLGWQMAYTGFDRKKMGNIAIIDYDDWVALVPLYTRGLQGTPVQKIYENYMKRMTNPPEIDLKNIT